MEEIVDGQALTGRRASRFCPGHDGKTKREKPTMPEITVSMAAGRTDEQKAGMMRDITQALVKNLGVDADAVVIQINEAPLAHKMKGGKTFVERAARTSDVQLHIGESRANNFWIPGPREDACPGMTGSPKTNPWMHATSS